MHQVGDFKGPFLNSELRVAAVSWRGRGFDIQFRRMFRRIPNAEKGKPPGHLLEKIRSRLAEAGAAVPKILIPNPYEML